MKICKIYKVFEDGRHNAFTDLCFWKDDFYLAFRNATSHLSMDGRVIVLKSKDLSTWEKIEEFGEDGDLRDPKFLCTKDTLFIYTPKRGKKPCVLFSSTEDGKRWKKLQLLIDEGVGFWRPKTKDDIHYVAIFYPSSFGEWHKWCSVLLSSVDGVHWKKVSKIYEGDGANETEIEFFDEMLFAFVRKEAPPSHLTLCKASPPYTFWSKKDMGMLLHGVVAKRVGERILIVARFKEEKEYRTGVFELKEEEISHLLTFQSGGDTSYAGLVQIENEIIVSYYSSHENPHGANIYIAYLKEE